MNPTSTSFSAAPNLRADATIVLLPEAMSPFNNGCFEGWGTALCWWANRIGYSERLSKQAADLFFNLEKGLGLNIARYNIGGGDDPAHHHIARSDSEVPGYLHWNDQTQRFEYDWTADRNQRNVLEKAKAACGKGWIAEGFSNSPPFFMTKSGCSSGAVRADENNLKDDQYGRFADYLADVALHFRDEYGIPFQSISAMNEPYTNYWSAFSRKQEGCHFDQGAAQSRMIIALSDALRARGLNDMVIAGTDETSVDTQIDSFAALSGAARGMLARIDVHTYCGSRLQALRDMAVENGKNLWMSEVDSGDTAGEQAGDMGAALWLANRVIVDMNGLMPSAWVLWQVIGQHASKDGCNGIADSGLPDTSRGYWGLAVADHDNETIVLTKKYYALGQFTRFIRPGCTLIASGANTLAIFDHDKKEVVIVAVNLHPDDVTCAYDLNGFASVGAEVRAVRTSGSFEAGENWAELPLFATYGKGFVAPLKANSITTFVVHDVQALCGTWSSTIMNSRPPA